MNTDDAIQGVKNQMHGIHNPGVGGSTPPPATTQYASPTSNVGLSKITQSFRRLANSIRTRASGTQAKFPEMLAEKAACLFGQIP